MKTYKGLYEKLCSKENIILAWRKARRGKARNRSVIEFEKNLERNLENLREELILFTYKSKSLKEFVVRDPKTRIIHASAFLDRVVHHAIINVLDPIYEKIFIYDSFASRKNKGTHSAVQRFDRFKQKVSRNGRVVKLAGRDRNLVEGYVLKADIKQYFSTVDHEVLINILKRKVKDNKLIWLISRILENYAGRLKGKGLPLGNYTSQFFANVYLNDLDYFVKHELKAKYYIRYVDDFFILHRSRKRLNYFRKRINNYLGCLKLELHPDKSQIKPLRNGISFLGYRVFYHYKLLRKRNLHVFQKRFEEEMQNYKKGLISKKSLIESLQGWFGYAKWANTYKFRESLFQKINEKRNYF